MLTLNSDRMLCCKEDVCRIKWSITKNMMIKTLFVIFFASTVIFARTHMVQAAPVEINENSFPDAAFREFVSSYFDEDADGVLSDDEIENITDVDLAEMTGIADLKGIELFNNMALLDCSEIGLKELDVSNNTELKGLNCKGNQLKTLDVSKNIALKNLYCYSNLLEELDVSNNINLVKLYCGDNPLTDLDVSHNASLEILNIDKGHIKGIDLSNNRNLKELKCYNGELTALDLGKNSFLEKLSLKGNNIPVLDLSNNRFLNELSCENNHIKELNIIGSDNLSILQCGENELTTLSVSQNFLLEDLRCGNNQITSLDLGKNKQLGILLCDGNRITELDLSLNPELVRLGCSSNGLSELMLGSKNKIYGIDCQNNNLSALDIGQCPNLHYLRCQDNQIEALSVSQNRLLTELVCNNNMLSSLDVYNNENLSILNCAGNNFTTVYINSSVETSDGTIVEEGDWRKLFVEAKEGYDGRNESEYVPSTKKSHFVKNWNGWDGWCDVDEKTLRLDGYVGYDTDIVIPSSAEFYGERYDVTIGSDFRVSKISGVTSVKVQDGGKVRVLNPTSFFAGNKTLKLVNLNNFDFGDTADLSFMFSDCESLTSVDFGNLDTSHVTNMEYLFEKCYKLTDVDFREIDTSNLEIMSNMFNYCESIKRVNLDAFDTSNVLYMHSLFFMCKNLEEASLSQFDTSNVLDLTYMFGHCESLKKVDMSSFDLSKCEGAGGIFANCKALETIRSPKIIPETFKFSLSTVHGEDISTVFVDEEGNKYTRLSGISHSLLLTRSDDSNEGDGNGTERIPVTGISFETSTMTIKEGVEEGVGYTIYPENATNQRVIWTSSNEEIVSFMYSNVLQGFEIGTATITGTTEDGGFSASCIVTVVPYSDDDPEEADKVEYRGGTPVAITLSNYPGEEQSVAIGETTVFYPKSLPYIGQKWSKALKDTTELVYIMKNHQAVGVKKIGIKKDSKIGTATVNSITFTDGTKLKKKDLNGKITITIEPYNVTTENAKNVITGTGKATKKGVVKGLKCSYGNLATSKTKAGKIPPKMTKYDSNAKTVTFSGNFKGTIAADLIGVS